MTSQSPATNTSGLFQALRQNVPFSLATILVLCGLAEFTLVLGDAGVLPHPRARMLAYEYGGFWPGLLNAWRPNYTLQPYTMFVSYSFLHSGPIHFMVNMITLYSLGRAVHARVGARGFLLVYGAAILGGACGFALLSNMYQPMIGASGGLFGLAGGLLAWNYVDRFTLARRLWPVLQALLGLLLLNVIMWWLMDGLLAWQTHLGGFVSGWIIALLVDPRSLPAPGDSGP